jgi:hypothetical protein
MRLTRRGGIVVGLLLAAAVTVTPDTTADSAQPVGSCPSASHLMAFEDGSGACYADGGQERYPIRVRGAELAWPEDTFPWDCHLDGNRICGPGQG